MFWEKLRRFMYGRYGTDALTYVLLIVGVVCSFLSRLFFWPAMILSYGLYIYVLFRTFSRNIPARQRELYAFQSISQRARRWYRLTVRAWQDRGEYKYFHCPNCKQVLRAPRGKGKIVVTCQKCHKEFNQKT